MYTLAEKQRVFPLLVARLIVHAYELGFRISFGEAYRTPEQAKLHAAAGKGILNSLHGERLAIDLNLFKGGVYLTRTEDHRELGEFWKSLSTPDYACCWGGDFRPSPDGNHYSIMHQGRK